MAFFVEVLTGGRVGVDGEQVGLLVLRKTQPLFSQLSLCLSRACLGKKMHFIYKCIFLYVNGAKSGVFRSHLFELPYLENGIFAMPFLDKAIILPRQARDKHRENSKKDAVFHTSMLCFASTCSEEYNITLETEECNALLSRIIYPG
eukprot:COSAG06_NODE_1917_length_8070_cov_51.606323_4_plen_147_part_00